MRSWRRCRHLDDTLDLEPSANALGRATHKSTPAMIQQDRRQGSATGWEGRDAFDTVASRLMLNLIYQETLGKTPDAKSLGALHRDQFEHYIIDGIRAGRLSADLRGYPMLTQGLRHWATRCPRGGKRLGLGENTEKSTQGESA